MKLRLVALLSLIPLSSLFAQVKTDTTRMPKDSVKVTPFVINEEKQPRKAKKVKQPDTTSYAQEYNRNKLRFQWGAREGITLNRFTTKEITAVRVSANGTPILENGKTVKDQILSNPEMVIGYQGGIFARFTSGWFYLQPEFFYGKKGGKFDILQGEGKLFKRVKATYSMIDIPILLGIRFRQARIFAGPLFEFPLSFSNSLRDAIQVYSTNNLEKDLFKRPIVGVSAGIGFEFNRFFIEGRFESIASTINYNISYNNDPMGKLQVSGRSLVIALGLISPQKP